MFHFDKESILSCLDHQEVLCAPHPKRADLSGARVMRNPVWTGRVSVWRNHAIEPLLPLMAPYLTIAGVDADFVLGGYDDSLSMMPNDGADVVLVWFDLDRVALDGAEAADWFVERIGALGARTTQVVVVPVWDDAVAHGPMVERLNSLPGVVCADATEACREAGVPVSDERSASLAGSRVSREAQVQLARWIGAHWLPAALLPASKMVAVDLDETLHHGVLVEDGIDGIEVTPGHQRLHLHLKTLAAEGFLLSLVSKNDRAEVEELFRARAGAYLVGLEDFFAIEVSWGPKDDAVARAASRANIDPSAVVFVDDNAGELLTVGLGCPGVGLVHAKKDPDLTVEALRWHPGLWRWRVDAAAAIRAKDLGANQERDLIRAGALSAEDYIGQLGVTLSVSVDDPSGIARLADLSGKTNQFNLAVGRLTEADLQRAVAEPSRHVVGVGLRDRLSDSGVIALLVCRVDSDLVVVEELAMSCRAMGRGLESIIIGEALRSLPCWESVRLVQFCVQRTPKNGPAREWLSTLPRSGNPGDVADIVEVQRTSVDSLAVPGSVVVER